MVSEVTGPASSVVTALDQRAVKVDRAPAAGGAAAPAQQSADVVSLTDLASRLQALTQAVADLPVVDRQQVETFRQALADGSYRIDPEAIAEKLAALESLLAGAQKA